MQRISWIAGIATLVLVLAGPAGARGGERLDEDFVKGVGVVIESGRKSLTLVGDIQLEITHRTRFVTEDGEEVPRAHAIPVADDTRGRSKRGRTRTPTSVGLSVVEYEGHQDGKRIKALRITPLFKNEAQ